MLGANAEVRARIHFRMAWVEDVRRRKRRRRVGIVNLLALPLSRTQRLDTECIGVFAWR